MTNGLPGDDVIDDDLADAEANADHSVPGDEPSTDEKRADRVWGILLGGLPFLLLGLVGSVSGLVLSSLPMIVGGAAVFFVGLLLYTASWLPPGVVLWRRLLVKSLKNYKSAASADAIGFIFRGSGSVDPRAVKYLGSDTEDQEGKWATKSTGEKWGAGVEGSKVDLLGRTPVAFFDEEDPDRVTAKYGRMAECVDMGQDRPLYENIQVDEVVVEKAVYPPGTDQSETVADGGTVQPAEKEVVDRTYRVENAGDAPIDGIIDLSSSKGTSGGRVSFEKAKELRDETATTEEMQRQEDRGRIAEMKPGADRKFVLKVLLIAAGIIGIVYLGPMIIEALFSSGGGGGGGGGVMPFSIAPMLQAVPAALGVA